MTGPVAASGRDLRALAQIVSADRGEGEPPAEGVAPSLLSDLLALLRPHLRQAYFDAERRRSGTPQLTPRQWELLRLLAAGHTNAQIARRLGISEGTVRTHLEHIYRLLQVSSRTAAVARAFADPAG